MNRKNDYRQNKVSVAFQGMKGAYSNMASEECFPNGKTIPCYSFEEMLDKTKRGIANYAMVPIENSVAGRVADIHNLLPESGLYITAGTFSKKLTTSYWFYLVQN